MVTSSSLRNLLPVTAFVKKYIELNEESCKVIIIIIMILSFFFFGEFLLLLLLNWSRVQERRQIESCEQPDHVDDDWEEDPPQEGEGEVGEVEHSQVPPIRLPCPEDDQLAVPGDVEVEVLIHPIRPVQDEGAFRDVEHVASVSDLIRIFRLIRILIRRLEILLSGYLVSVMAKNDLLGTY